MRGVPRVLHQRDGRTVAVALRHRLGKASLDEGNVDARGGAAGPGLDHDTVHRLVAHRLGAAAGRHVVVADGAGRPGGLDRAAGGVG